MNLLLIAAIVVAVLKMRSGFKRGLVKEVIMLVTLFIICTMIALIANGLQSFSQGQTFHAIVMIFFLMFLGAVQFLLKPIFFSAKIVVNLPIVSWLDHLLGLLLGLVESILLLWTLYFFVMIMDMGAISEQILEWTRENALLRWFFENNYLAWFLSIISQKVQFLPKLL